MDIKAVILVDQKELREYTCKTFYPYYVSIFKAVSLRGNVLWQPIGKWKGYHKHNDAQNQLYSLKHDYILPAFVITRTDPNSEFLIFDEQQYLEALNELSDTIFEGDKKEPGTFFFSERDQKLRQYLQTKKRGMLRPIA